jgi:hypothetical protein
MSTVSDNQPAAEPGAPRNALDSPFVAAIEERQSEWESEFGDYVDTRRTTKQ